MDTTQGVQNNPHTIPQSFVSKNVVAILSSIIALIVVGVLVFLIVRPKKATAPEQAIPLAIPTIPLKQEYSNPFDEKASYENPFDTTSETYKNPFDAIE